MNQLTKKGPALAERFVSEADYKRKTFFCESQEGHTFEDLKTPEYWAMSAHKLKPRDRVDVMAFDGSWYAQLVVMASSINWAKMGVISFSELVPAQAVAADEPFEVKCVGSKFRVLRKTDKAVVHKDASTYEDAKRWLDEHVKTLAS